MLRGVVCAERADGRDGPRAGCARKLKRLVPPAPELGEVRRKEVLPVRDDVPAREDGAPAPDLPDVRARGVPAPPRDVAGDPALTRGADKEPRRARVGRTPRSTPRGAPGGRVEDDAAEPGDARDGDCRRRLLRRDLAGAADDKAKPRRLEEGDEDVAECVLPVVAVDPVDPVPGKRDRVADARPRHVECCGDARDVARAGQPRAGAVEPADRTLSRGKNSGGFADALHRRPITHAAFLKPRAVPPSPCSQPAIESPCLRRCVARFPCCPHVSLVSCF